MNLEVLYLSADLTGNNTLRTIAVNHADTNIANHIRSDGEQGFHLLHANLLIALGRRNLARRGVLCHQWIGHFEAYCPGLRGQQYLESWTSLGHLWLCQQCVLLILPNHFNLTGVQCTEEPGSLATSPQHDGLQITSFKTRPPLESYHGIESPVPCSCSYDNLIGTQGLQCP